MRNIIPVVAIALAGCGAGEGEIWLVTIPAMTNFECTGSIEENFEEADPVEEEEGNPDWIIESEMNLSDSLQYAQIVEGKKGTAFLTIGDMIYPGEKTREGYTFQWTNTDESTYSEAYTPFPYAYSEVVKSETTSKIVLNKNKDTGGLSGHWELVTLEDATYTETDQWEYLDAEGELPSTGQINAISYYVLDGSGETNEWETPECEDDECRIVLKEDCAGVVDIKADFVGYGDEGVFAALENADQPVGTGSSF